MTGEELAGAKSGFFCAVLRPIHTAQTNAYKPVCWVLSDQCVTPVASVGVGQGLFSPE